MNKENNTDTHNTFRDAISTVDKEGKRVWVYPKMPKGVLHNLRVVVTIVLLSFLVGAPFIKINGLPLLMFNILERKFIIFGKIFWPQDFYLFGLGLIAGIVFLILFTVIYGRIFCGWICPQTIFMEMVFRKIEYLIEGDYQKQKALDKMPWNNEKILKKTSKHLVFYILAFGISNLFLAYIVGIDELWKIVTDPPSEHIVGLIAIILFSIVFYWIFAFFREQVCIIACPYGRLQGVMLDKNSVVVAYDHKRGEPRDKLRKNETRTAGDCIDCKQCIHVCPTGIDIRNGTQLECINCTACIDVCDDIMVRIDKPKGLIRFASENNIEDQSKFKFTTRTIAYSFVLVAILGALGLLLYLHSDIDMVIMRTKGMTYQTTDDNVISNLYNLTVVNKSQEDIPFSLKLLDHKGTIEMVGNAQLLPSQGHLETVFFIKIQENDLQKMSTELLIGLYNKEGKLISKKKTKFLGPSNY